VGYGGVWGYGWRWFKLGQVAGICGCGNEPAGSIKYKVFIDWLKTG